MGGTGSPLEGSQHLGSNMFQPEKFPFLYESSYSFSPAQWLEVVKKCVLCRAKRQSPHWRSIALPRLCLFGICRGHLTRDSCLIGRTQRIGPALPSKLPVPLCDQRCVFIFHASMKEAIQVNTREQLQKQFKTSTLMPLEKDVLP